MCKKRIFIILFFGFSIYLYSQENVKKLNFKRIKKEIKKRQSKFYYPSLVKKFSRGIDMSLDEKRHLYYGYAFLKSYEPYKITKYFKKINQLVTNNKWNTENLNRLLNFLNLELSNRPFDIKLLELKLFVFKRLHNIAQQNVIKKQINIIKDAIFSSGSGLKEKSPFSVIFINNEYDVLRFLNLKQAQNFYVNKAKEYIKVLPNKRNIKGVYFDINLITKRINSKAKK